MIIYTESRDEFIHLSHYLDEIGYEWQSGEKLDSLHTVFLYKEYESNGKINIFLRLFYCECKYRINSWVLIGHMTEDRTEECISYKDYFNSLTPY